VRILLPYLAHLDPREIRVTKVTVELQVLLVLLDPQVPKARRVRQVVVDQVVVE